MGNANLEYVSCGCRADGSRRFRHLYVDFRDNFAERRAYLGASSFFGFGRFGGTILPMVFSNRSHASDTVSIAWASFRFTRFLGDLAIEPDPQVIPYHVKLTPQAAPT